MRKIFITGATGFLGSYLLKRFLDDEDIMPIVLARAKRGVSSIKRIEDVFIYFYGKNKYKIMLKRIKIVKGEVDKKNLGLDTGTRGELIKDVDEIYHSAAIAQFRVPLGIIRKVNVEGTENVLKFAMECKNKGRLKKFNHISTTYVGGTKEGVFYENEFDVSQKFNNTYEQTKFESELLVRDYMKKGLSATIFRPSILTGDSINGKTSNFKMLYQPLHFFAAELFDAIPADRDTQFNLIPVDFVAHAIYTVTNNDMKNGAIYHITNPITVSAGHFIDVASDFFGFRKPEFIPLSEFDMDRLTVVQKNLLEPYIPYFNYRLSFDSTNAKRTWERKGLLCPIVDDDLLIKLFKFCIVSGYIKPKRQYVTAG